MTQVNGDPNELLYLRYIQAKETLRARLGIAEPNWVVDSRYAEFTTWITEWLVHRLNVLGIDADIKDKVKVIYDAFDWVRERVLDESGPRLDLVKLMYSEHRGEYTGIDKEFVDAWPDDKVLELDRLSEDYVYLLTNMLSTLKTILEIQYPHLFKEKKGTCHCCCNKGGKFDGQLQWEAFKSGVLPEEVGISSAHTHKDSSYKASNCTCCYRRY